MVSRKSSVPAHSLELDGSRIEWVDKWAYLGVTLLSGPTFDCCVKETVKKFYGALNSILRVDGRSDDMVMLRLMEAHCIPIRSYAIEVIHVRDRDERRKLRVAYNAVYRKLFGYHYRESVTQLQGEKKSCQFTCAIQRTKKRKIISKELCKKSATQITVLSR